MALIHNQNNMYLCHFRRLIHLSMIFRRRFLAHLFVKDQLLERFVQYYNSNTIRTTLHGYVLQMLWDIYNHDQRDDDEEEDANELKPNFSQHPEDQWDIVAFFNQNEVWKQFIHTISIQMEAQNANTETQQNLIPNMNVQNNQQQLDQLLQNLLGPNNDQNDS
eukprot:267058_1